MINDIPTHEIPSGLGGRLYIEITERLGDERVRARVAMPRNPDFHGAPLTASVADLTPLCPDCGGRAHGMEPDLSPTLCVRCTNGKADDADRACQ